MAHTEPHPLTYFEQMKLALYWNSVFETARARLRWLESISHPTAESHRVAESLRSEWVSLTISNTPHPERLHPDRFQLYHSPVTLALLKDAPVVITGFKHVNHCCLRSVSIPPQPSIYSKERSYAHVYNERISTHDYKRAVQTLPAAAARALPAPRTGTANAGQPRTNGNGKRTTASDAQCRCIHSLAKALDIVMARS